MTGDLYFLNLIILISLHQRSKIFLRLPGLFTFYCQECLLEQDAIGLQGLISKDGQQRDSDSHANIDPDTANGTNEYTDTNTVGARIRVTISPARNDALRKSVL